MSTSRDGCFTIPCDIQYAILLITTAYRWCMTTLAVSDKRIPEWLSISRSLQDWGMVYWEAACLVWSLESCVTAARCSCAREVHWKVKVTSSLTDVWQQQTVWAVIVLCTIHFHPWLHENHTRAWRHRLKSKRSNMFIRNQRGMSWAEIASDWNMVSNQQRFIDQSIN